MEQREGDVPAGMPGGKAALRQQMFEMARQSLDEGELESVAIQVKDEPEQEAATDAGAPQDAGGEPGDVEERPAHPKTRRGLRRARRRR